jgi:hypothetical protein
MRRMTSHAFLFRQVALVGYGTQFLRHKLPLEDWYRHGVFFDARFQFRSLEDKRLLADDFTVWLGTLAQAGATRLSLHPAAQLKVDGDYAVAVHFPDRYQVWAVGVEQPAWQERFEFPRARGYAGDVDSYWLTGEQAGQLPVPATNWKEFAAAIAADLDTSRRAMCRCRPGHFFRTFRKTWRGRGCRCFPACHVPRWRIASSPHWTGSRAGFPTIRIPRMKPISISAWTTRARTSCCAGASGWTPG